MSEEFLALQGGAADKTLAKYFALTEAAESNREKEIEAAIIIQKVWRGRQVRVYIRQMNENATDIKRVFRGWKGRRKFARLKQDQLLEVEKEFYNSMANKIQKVWRGHHSRATVLDFYKRQAYLKAVTQKGAELRVTLNENLQSQLERQEEEKREAEAREFASITENLHHMLSTESQPGVFSSRFGKQFEKTAYGISIDDHIRDSFANRRARIKMEEEEQRHRSRAQRESRRAERQQQQQEDETAYTDQQHQEHQQDTQINASLPAPQYPAHSYPYPSHVYEEDSDVEEEQAQAHNIAEEEEEEAHNLEEDLQQTTVMSQQTVKINKARAQPVPQPQAV